jgi:hypothetical protein
MAWGVPGVPGAEIREVTRLPARLAGGARIAPCVEATADRWLLVLPRVARCLVSDGVTIAFEFSQGAERAIMAL